MKKVLGTTLAIAALAMLGACSSGVDNQTTPDAGSSVAPESPTENYTQPDTETPGAATDESSSMDKEGKAGDEMAPSDSTGSMESPSEDTGSMESPSSDAPAAPGTDAPAGGSTSN